MRLGNILIVDDEKLIRWSLKELLSGEGYTVKAVEDGKSALEALADESFDLVLLDYMLPDMNGIQILAEIRVTQPDLLVMMITSHSSIEHAVDAMKIGVLFRFRCLA
jgi:DNA-binding NtrC family response regulator